MKICNYVCNKCGKEFDDLDCDFNPFSVEHTCIYHSKHYGFDLSFYLCPDCLDDFVESDDWEIEILNE